MQVPYLVNQVFFAEHGTGQDVVVPCEVLCAALQNKVHPELNRPLVERSAERTVYECQNVMPVRYLLDFDKVKDIQVRVGRRFGKYETCILFDRFLKDFIISKRDNSALNGELFQI